MLPHHPRDCGHHKPRGVPQAAGDVAGGAARDQIWRAQWWPACNAYSVSQVRGAVRIGARCAGALQGIARNTKSEYTEAVESSRDLTGGDTAPCPRTSAIIPRHPRIVVDIRQQKAHNWFCEQ